MSKRSLSDVICDVCSPDPESWPPSVAFLPLDCVFEPVRRGKGICDEAHAQKAPTPASWRGALMRAMRLVGASPFMIRADRPWSFRLVLWGDELSRVAEWLVGLERAGRYGIGRGRVRARLVSVGLGGRVLFDGARVVGEAEPIRFDGREVDAASGDHVELRLVSPLRICRDGRPQRTLTAASLFAALGRRAARIARDAGFGAARLFAPAFEGEFVVETRFIDRMRHSSRQGRAIGLGGVVGSVRLSGCRLVDRAWLRFGATFGVGKATAMGCGAIDVVERAV